MAESMLSAKNPNEKNTDKPQKGEVVKPSGTSNKENVQTRREQQKTVDKPVVKSQASKSSSNVHAVDPFSKEIGLILKEINSNMYKQGEQLKKLSDRVDALYDEPYYDNYETYDTATGNDFNDPQSVCDDQVGEAESDTLSEDFTPSKRQKMTFKGLSDKFLLAEKVDNEVNEDLADFVNSSFRNGVSEDRVLEICKEIYRPQNCESLCKTRVNPGIWRLLKPQTQTDDAKMQSIQNHIIKASTDIVKLLDKNSETFDSTSVEWGTSALALLGQSNKLINNKRKEAHKQDLDPKFYPLTSPTLPYTDYLYGNETDVNKNIKDISDMSRIGKVGRGSGRGRGNRGAPYHRGRGPRRGRGGRGFYQKDVSFAYAKNLKEGQKK